jgi:4-hydroxyphenylacetate 3-monooxygenase
MLKTGDQHLEGLRDGRVVYLGNERIDDVTAHPAFRHAARTVADLYDAKADPTHRDRMSFEENGERFSMYFLRPKSREDLTRRMKAHKAIADRTHGLFGRSPDHVASFVTGMSMKPEELDVHTAGYGANLVKYYYDMRARDAYAAYAVLPPQAARDPDFYQHQNLPIPSLRVVAEEDDGLVLSGMKMLATAAVFADEVWLGNLLPLAPSQKKEAVTCAVPCNASGLTLWSRKAFAREASSEFDMPLTWRFDETDSMIMCDGVKVPWERVFAHDDAVLAREIYIKTPSHCLGNHQSNVRFWAKMQLIVGLASRVTQASGADQIPAVREKLGRLASLEALIGGLVHGQIDAHEGWPEPYVCFNRRIMYAALNWCTESYSEIIDVLRDLSGGGVFQMPADVSVMEDEDLRRRFEQYWQTPQLGAVPRMKLFRLVWDLVGSEFAGRHLQYEKFYAGASFIVRNHSHREAPWDNFDRLVEDLLAGYDLPAARGSGVDASSD